MGEQAWLEGVMTSILGAIVWNIQDRRFYLSGIPDRVWSFVAPYVAPVGTTEHGISPEVADHPEAERGFVLLRQRPMVECNVRISMAFAAVGGGCVRSSSPPSGHPATGPSP